MLEEEDDQLPHDPGAYNDALATSVIDTPIAAQSRFVRGDANFAGVVDFADRQLISANVGVGLDDTEIAVNDRNNDDQSDDLGCTAWRRQLVGFNSVVSMVRVDLNDGTTGEWESGVTVTQVGDRALALLVPRCSIADLAAPLGTRNFCDVLAYLDRFNAYEPTADLAAPFGTINFLDALAYITAVNAGCP